MKLILLFGPPAVGKMTVGQALAKRTEFKLFYNHLSLELVNQFFDFGTEEFDRLDKIIRFNIFNEFAKSDLPGLIFTIVWAFNQKEDEEYMNEICEIFKGVGAEIYMVELSADLEVRLLRNKHENRLAHKASKRDLEMSERSLLHFQEIYQMNSKEGELPEWNILRIDNTNRTPDEVAKMIQAHFDL